MLFVYINARNLFGWEGGITIMGFQKKGALNKEKSWNVVQLQPQTKRRITNKPLWLEGITK